MKVDKNLTEFENLLRLINASNPELKLRAEHIKSMTSRMNHDGFYTEKDSCLDVEMSEGSGYFGNFRFYYNKMTIQGFKEIPEYLVPLPVLLTETPEEIFARYMARYELASDTQLYWSYFVAPTEDNMYGSISIATDGNSLIYQQVSHIKLFRVNRLDEDLPINIMVGTSTLDGFEPTRTQLLIQ
ncbi:hypothetical protein KW841_27565 [Pseudomonas sp. PDM28]|jgi:hypothetical protein|uniref:hypothetical protein n=1 Tax=Pseudomonas sp. PDM28 TaxID=2854770 RepID=UPI001C493F50|nr:hypothetical protein [Pseudomonas sp. PDM28]MBV7556114.1 hypothetical protein [Pseudomonas sp. PDM28]